MCIRDRLWFGGVFTIRFVGSPPFLLILSGQAKYFFIPFKGKTKRKLLQRDRDRDRQTDRQTDRQN